MMLILLKGLFSVGEVAALPTNSLSSLIEVRPSSQLFPAAIGDEPTVHFLPPLALTDT